MRRAHHEEAGFQLIELLVVMGLLTVVLGAILAILDVTNRTTPPHIERGQRIREGENAVARMVRDVRAAKSVTVTSSRVVDLVVQSPTGTDAIAYRSVRIDCSTGQACVRTEGPVGGALSGAVSLVTGVTNTDVFSPTPATGDPAYLGITLSLGIRGSGRAYTVVDGAQLRNAA